MPVPDYPSLMAPVICALADGSDDSLAKLRSVLTERSGLNEEDLQAKIPEHFAWPPGHRDGWQRWRQRSAVVPCTGLLGWPAELLDHLRANV
jgi:hypothetical protein